MRYKYEPHCHTFPVSKCAKASPIETVDFYRTHGYDGIIITNHFIDGNINISKDAPIKEKLEFYFSDYEKAKEYAKQVNFKVFLGVEVSYNGSDFIVYGLDKQWYLDNSDVLLMKKSDEFRIMREAGAFIIHAHPYREDFYIDHIRLFPRHVDGVEVFNASRPEAENEMAQMYAKHYGLFTSAGSDNHVAGACRRLAGISCEEPLNSVEDFIMAMREKKTRIFIEEN